MSGKTKKVVYIILGILILCGGLIQLNRMYHFQFLLARIRSSPKTSILTNVPQRIPASTPVIVPPEKGRVRTDFAPNTPPGFPAGLPVDQKPVSVVSSYVETFVGEESASEAGRTQVTYSYVTKTSALSAGDAFEKYLKASGFTVEKKYDPAKTLYTLRGSNTAGDVFTVSVTVYNAGRKEQIVTVSEIVQGIKK